MSTSGNHVAPTRAPFAGACPSLLSVGERCARRLVLRSAKERESPAETILVEYHGKDIVGSRVHADSATLRYEEYPGRVVAAEWQGSLGWTRFLWCQERTRT